MYVIVNFVDWTIHHFQCPFVTNSIDRYLYSIDRWWIICSKSCIEHNKGQHCYIVNLKLFGSTTPKLLRIKNGRDSSGLAFTNFALVLCKN